MNLSIFNNKRWLFLFLLFLTTLLFRFPTLFNDYYDVDELAAIVQTHEYLSGAVPGKDFIESKLPVYHAIFKVSYLISEKYGWTIVHAFTILIVFLTALFVYLIGGRLFSYDVGILAALCYAILISSFNRNFMATNGEIVFNLPVIGGFYFFILFLSGGETKKSLITQAGDTYKSNLFRGGKRAQPPCKSRTRSVRGREVTKKYLMLFLAIGMGIIAALVKVQGAILLVFYVFFTFIYYPYYSGKASRKYWSGIIFAVFLIISLLFIGYHTKNYFAKNILFSLYSKLDYMAAKGTNPFYFLMRFAHHQGMLFLWHFIVWMPIVIYLRLFIRNRFKAATLEESSAALLFILTYLMTFSGGARLYFHYYMALYPALTILSAYILFNSKEKIVEFIRNKVIVFVLVPSLFFLFWNIKDIVIKHYFPDAFYKEGRVLYWTRGVLLGSLKHYLLPGDSYRDVCVYIKKITGKDDRIFVWGDGPYLHYFSQRRMGNKHLWPKTAASLITKLYNSNDKALMKKAYKHEKYFIRVLRKRKPFLFVDTSLSGLSKFTYPVPPRMQKYLNKHYSFIKEIDKMKIYRLK